MENPQAKFWSLQHQFNVNLPASTLISKFHQGIEYKEYLKQIHLAWKPSNYLEIGVETGATLALAQCRAVAIDPKFQLHGNPIGRRTETYLFQLRSDDFFSQHDLRKFLPNGVDFAFLDGMHQFEYLLRDFINTEKYSHKDTVVTVHDCYPVNADITNRDINYPRLADPATRNWWTGDVWKLLPILRDFRSDLKVTVLDCPPTGLVVIQNLDPNSRALIDAYDEIFAKYQDMILENYNIDNFRAEFSTTDSRRVFQADLLRNFLISRNGQ